MEFWKYSAAGNDFILLTPEVRKKLTPQIMRQLCDRKFGIGADGILFVEEVIEKPGHFLMNYINADGGEVDMCGNGARACVHWYSQKNQKEKASFTTVSGANYRAHLIDRETIEVTMNELKDEGSIKVDDLLNVKKTYYANTGVPHCVFLLSEEQDLDDPYWMEQAPKIRHEKRFSKGCNVNFAKILNDESVRIRTFERGVEAETLACGTGVVAVARFLKKQGVSFPLKAKVAGGELQVRFVDDDCWLAGPVKQVFKGEIDLSSL